MAECDQCGTEIEDPHECEECGGVFCEEHEKPILHECTKLTESAQETAPTCAYCGDHVADPEARYECEECDDVFCESHREPVFHDCPSLNESTDSDEVCDHCGSPIDGGYECPGCEGTFCSDHEKPILHDCSALDGHPADDDDKKSLAEIEADEGGLGLSMPQIAVGVVALVLVAGLATGMVSIPGLGGAPADGGSSGTPPGPTTAADPQPFDSQQYRTSILGWVNGQREANGNDELAINESHEQVVDRLAADLAAANATLEGDGEFNITRRLKQAGESCSTAGGGLKFRVPYNRLMETGDGTEVYTSTDELAQATIDAIEPQLQSVLETGELETHALGVQLSENDYVYVVYLAC